MLPLSTIRPPEKFVLSNTAVPAVVLYIDEIPILIHLFEVVKYRFCK